MRILIYGLNFAPELTGIGKYSGEMAAFLAQKGHQVRVITTPPYYPHWAVQPGHSAGAYSTEAWRGVTVYRCPLWLPAQRDMQKKISSLQRMLYLLSFAISSLPVALRQIRWRPERVILIAPSIFNTPAAVLVAHLAGAKSWLHIQDFELDAALRLKMLPGLGIFFGLAQKIESSLYLGFDRVSTISQRMLQHLWTKGVQPSRTLLFPNWVDTSSIFPLNGDQPLRQALGLPGNARIILYSGNIGQKQGLEILIEAARQCIGQPDLLFVLCGGGSARSQMEALAQELPNVRFLPLQPVEKLNELLNMADIHVLPQAAGAADLVMPSKLAGMLASGRPVIVTANPGTELAEVMLSIGRVIPPGQPAQLAEAIRSLLLQPALRQELGQCGRRYVEQTWSKDIILKNFMEMLIK